MRIQIHKGGMIFWSLFLMIVGMIAEPESWFAILPLGILGLWYASRLETREEYDKRWRTEMREQIKNRAIQELVEKQIEYQKQKDPSWVETPAWRDEAERKAKLEMDQRYEIGRQMGLDV